MFDHECHRSANRRRSWRLKGLWNYEGRQTRQADQIEHTRLKSYPSHQTLDVKSVRISDSGGTKCHVLPSLSDSAERAWHALRKKDVTAVRIDLRTDCLCARGDDKVNYLNVS